MTITGQYQFNGIAQHEGIRCALIGVEGTLKQSSDKESGALDLLSFELSTSTLSGTLHFDNQLGLPRSSEIEVTFTANFGFGDQNHEIELKQTTTTTMANKPDKAVHSLSQVTTSR